MIISDEHKFIFIHNPKCAGTTVRKSLEKYDSRVGFYWMFDTFEGQKIDKAHLPLDIFKRYRPEDFALLDSYFAFGFVRNPYRRFVSSFNETHKNLYKKLSEGEEVLKLYKDALNKFAVSLEITRTGQVDFQHRHCERQCDFYFNDGKRRADLIIKLEKLESSMSKLTCFNTTVASSSRSWSTHLNKKVMSQKVSDLLNKTSIEHLRSFYMKDFLLFDYDPLDVDV